MVRLRKDLEKQEKLKLERRADGQLWAVSNGEERAVRLHRCFPWSEPGRYLSLRDTENEEFALVRSLAEVGFVLEVERITGAEEEIEIRTWKVETRQGPRSFQTRLDDWPMDVPGGGILIRDVAGDLYHVADPDKLDAKSRTWLRAFLD